MHDALNHIDQRYATYGLKTDVVSDAKPDAAVAQAAHDVLISLFVSQTTSADSLLAASLSAISDGLSKEQRYWLGKDVARAILHKRSNDGVALAQYAFPSGTLAGQYRATPPYDKAPYYNFISMPAWGKVDPFSETVIAQFRVAAPYLVNSPQYTKDYNEVKQLGCKDCKARTEEQTEIGLFWMENIPTSFNRIARSLITEKKLNGWEAARLFALMHMALADASISAFDNKFLYTFWRPVTAITMGETDGNPDTKGDASWNTMAAPTPPVPDYPSNHAMDAGAAAEILKSFFLTDEVNFTANSTSLPGVTRSYTNFSTAAREVSLSRIYVGFHFRHAVEVGEEQGRNVGKYVFDHCLQKKVTRPPYGQEEPTIPGFIIGYLMVADQ